MILQKVKCEAQVQHTSEDQPTLSTGQVQTTHAQRFISYGVYLKQNSHQNATKAFFSVNVYESNLHVKA